MVDNLEIEKESAKSFILYAEKHNILKKSFQGECPNCGNFLIEILEEELNVTQIFKECNQCFKTVEIEKGTLEIILYFNISLFEYVFQEIEISDEEKEKKKNLSNLFNYSQQSGITNNEKGKLFEQFSKELLKMVNEFEFKKQNQLTETSEIDLIFFNKSNRFGFSCDYFIVQSKNQKKTTGIQTVCHLISDMLIRNVNLGFIISSSNISRNAYKRISQHFIQNQLTIIIIDKKNINSFFNNMKLDDIIEIEYYNLRFKNI